MSLMMMVMRMAVIMVVVAMGTLRSDLWFFLFVANIKIIFPKILYQLEIIAFVRRKFVKAS